MRLQTNLLASTFIPNNPQTVFYISPNNQGLGQLHYLFCCCRSITLFFLVVAMVNHIICDPLIRLFRSLCMSVTQGNCDPELNKPIPNSCSETKNSELRISEFGYPEFRF